MTPSATRLLLALVFVTASTFPVAAGERWTIVRTGHFTVVSEASQVATGEAARNLERFRAALLTALPEAEPPRAEVAVYLLDSPRSFRAHASIQDLRHRKRFAGVYRYWDLRPILVLDASNLGSSLHLARSGYAGSVLSNSGRPSLWLWEGLTEYFAYYVPAETRATFGDLSRGYRLHVAKESEKSVSAVLDVKSYPDDPDDRDTFENSALLLVHALIHGTEPGIPGVLDLWERLDRDESLESALSAVYGFGVEGLQALYERYRGGVEHWPTTAVPFEMPAEAKRVRFEPLEGADLDARLGDLFRSAGDEGRPEARSRYRRALKRTPDHPLALAGLVQVDVADGRPAEAEQRCAAAAKSGISAAEVGWACATALLAEPCRGGPTALLPRYREARRWLDRAKEDPVYEEVVPVARAVTLLPEPLGVDEAAEVLDADEDSEFLVGARLVLAARRGDRERASVLAERLSKDDDADEVRDWIRCVANAIDDPEEAARVLDLAGLTAPRSSRDGPAPPRP